MEDLKSCRLVLGLLRGSVPATVNLLFIIYPSLNEVAIFDQFSTNLRLLALFQQSAFAEQVARC
jgi:hypothetical protein